MKIELVKIDELDLDPKNARKHDAKNLKAIADSLEQFGQRKPIVVWGRTVVAGNGTMAAARTLGWTEITIARVPDDWSADQVKAYALADNRSAELAEWDEQVLASQLLELQEAEFDIELLGFELPVDELAEVVEDEIPEQVEPKSKLGDVWKLGRHRLLCGDATSVDALDTLVAGNQIDMVWTDPPYGIAHSGKGIEGASKGNDFGQILGDDTVQVAIDSFRLATTLYADAVQIWWGANYYPTTLPNGYGWLVWDKEREGDTFSGAEIAFVNKGVRVDVFRHQWHGMIRASERSEKRVHPTQKPIALVDFCFKNYGQPKSVLDLFGGSGSTLIACEQTDRTCYMMELDPKYVDVIIARWEKLTGLTAELIEG
jgi:site-specific DNA-methyltransferase (adenine-specific)